MRSKRTQKSAPIGSGKSAPKGTEAAAETTILNAEIARREAERKYRDIFENAVEGIFQTRPGGGFITANPALARMLGFESPEELIRARAHATGGTYYVHPERRVELKRLLDQHEAVRGFEFEAYRKDGTKIWMSDNVRVVRDVSGRPLYYEGTVEDITERKRAEELLKQSQSQLAEGQRLAHVGSWNWDIKNESLTWSDELYHIYGLNPREFKPTYERFLEVIHPEDRHIIARGIEECLRNHEPFSHHERIVRPSGEVRTLHSHGSVVCDQQGTPIRMFGACQDVTERTLAENAQREAERKYRDIFTFAPVGIYQSLRDGTLITANKALAEMLGYDSVEELLKVSLADAYFAPDGRAKLISEFEDRGFAIDLEIQWKRKDGAPIWVQLSAHAIRGAHGTTEYFEGFVRDVNDRKLTEAALRKSEERYRELFENDRDAIYVHDLDGVYTSVNRAAEKLSGYSREEILGKHFWDFVAPEYVSLVGENLGKKVEELGETNYEVEIINRDGARVPVEVSSRLISEHGTTVGVQGSARDITERKRAQQALLTYSRRLLEAQEAERGRIARELHDQIGQMLTALKLNLHAIQAARDAHEAGLLIEDNLKMLDDALEQVRDLSVDLRPLLLDDLGLVTALRWFVDHQAPSKGVRAEFTSDSLDPDLRFSPELETACFRIAQEALTNVARHARAKTVTVRLSRTRDYLILLVEDDGVGFDMEALQGHARTNATLGLRGMEERAHAVGGRVKIDSATNKGTQVFVELPIAMPNGRKP